MIKISFLRPLPIHISILSTLVQPASNNGLVGTIGIAVYRLGT